MNKSDMKTVALRLLLVNAFACSVVAQTISGYTEARGAAEPHREAPPRIRWLEYPGTPVEGWRATLRLSTNTFQVTSNILAEFVIKNVSTKELKLVAAWPLLGNGFSIHILDKNQAEVPLTTFGQAQKSSGGAGPSVSHSVQPGKEVVLSLELHKLYQLDSPGVYTVQATRSLPSPNRARRLQLATGMADIAIHSGVDSKKD
jgi:hypothetical protein